MKYPIGVQSFEKLRTAGMCYVDKTSLLFDIVQNVNYGFLSRPRRFGKSLLHSTMEAYFEGKKELFEGLAIMKLEKNCIKYPVIKVSVFSDLNNIDDISMWDKQATICGLTKDKICRYFDDEVEYLAQANKLSKKDCYEKQRLRYDGYHFCHDCEGVYNPYSLLHTLSKETFGDYWFLGKTAEEALTQIEIKNYALPYAANTTTVYSQLQSID